MNILINLHEKVEYIFDVLKKMDLKHLQLEGQFEIVYLDLSVMIGILQLTRNQTILFRYLIKLLKQD